MKIPDQLKKILKQNRQINIGFELFEFSLLDSIYEFQAGYSYNANDQCVISDWNESWIVFASSNADPLIYNSDDSKIYFDRHGRGGWSPVEIFLNLAEMEDVLHKLQNVVSEAGDNLMDEEFFIRGQYVIEMKNIINEILSPLHAKNLIESMEIESYA